MGIAKVVSLRSRPLQASHLCFEVDGILGQLNTQLGAAAVAFDFPAFYATLASAPTIAGDPSLLLYDFLEIQAFVQTAAMASLRAEPRKAALHKAVTARQNSYYAKYGNISGIVAQINTLYSPSVTGSKPVRLEVLSAIANDQASALKAAYTSDGRLGVVKTTSSVLNSNTVSSGTSGQKGTSNQTGINNQIGESANVASENLPNLPPADSTLASHGFGFSGPDLVNLDLVESDNSATSTSTESSTSQGLATETQTIANTDYGYRVPYLESQAQNERAQISLIDQQFSQFMYSQQLPNLTQVFLNELNSIDVDVYRLQIAFLNSILMSPFAGTVTGVYKNPGDAVRAGEPVVRVENNTTVLLVATLIYRDLISIGSTVTVQTALYDSSSAPTTISGTVVAARGHQSEDDQWDVVVSCNNVGPGGSPILPLNYHFDFDDTVVTVT